MTCTRTHMYTSLDEDGPGTYRAQLRSGRFREDPSVRLGGTEDLVGQNGTG